MICHPGLDDRGADRLCVLFQNCQPVPLHGFRAVILTQQRFKCAGDMRRHMFCNQGELARPEPGDRTEDEIL